jgi:hypothetical protein
LRKRNWLGAIDHASILRQKAEMFDRRAEQAIDPISKQHYREMATHYRQLLVEHLDYQAQREIAD